MIFLFFILSWGNIVFAQVNDPVFWKENRELPNPINEKWASGNFANIFSDSTDVQKEQMIKGQKHALFYPVNVTGILIPYQILKNFYTQTLKADFNDFYKRIGLNSYPKVNAPEFNLMEVNKYQSIDNILGATLIEREGVKGLTFSCSACHSAELFGKTILGLTNRFPGANTVFKDGQKLARYISDTTFKKITKATQPEFSMYSQAREAFKYIGVNEPVTLGLDASLAQVALSLGIRDQDEFATMSETTWKNQHKKLQAHPFYHDVADSKPMVWWNVKYKTRFLADGSIVSGNPVYTNFLWNEIGRGSDLKKLSTWFSQNEETVIRELTVAVFAAKAPRYTDFFGKDAIDIEKAQAGEKHFVQNCQACHGIYEKNWKQSSQTLKVYYHRQTPVFDVGTDAKRYLGMKYLADPLNRLKISKDSGIKVIPQKGYVPPPLVGIWARYPYLHNNSVPDLCSLLTPANLRPKKYFAGPAIDQQKDYDQNCVGYPKLEKVPSSWKKQRKWLFDSSKVGLSNQGHEKGLQLNTSEKLELIEFLKTL